MIKARGSVTVHRPIKDVFGYVSDPGNQSTWQPGLTEVKHSGSGRGSSITEVRKVMGRRVEHTMEVTDFQEGRKISHKGPATSHEGAIERHIHFSEVTPGTTRVDLELDLDTRGALKAATPVMQRMVQREVDSDLLHLKDILESDSDLHAGVSKLPAHGRVTA